MSALRNKRGASCLTRIRVRVHVLTPELQLCATIMEPVVAGFNANGIYQGAKFTGPDTQECDAIGTGDFCTWGCQRKYSANVQTFGCCAESTRTYLKVDLQA